jgi:hypothetical protein
VSVRRTAERGNCPVWTLTGGNSVGHYRILEEVKMIEQWCRPECVGSYREGKGFEDDYLRLSERC